MAQKVDVIEASFTVHCKIKQIKMNFDLCLQNITEKLLCDEIQQNFGYFCRHTHVKFFYCSYVLVLVISANTKSFEILLTLYAFSQH